MRLDIDYGSHRASRGETIFCRIDEQFLIETKCFKERYGNPLCWISYTIFNRVKLILLYDIVIKLIYCSLLLTIFFIYDFVITIIRIAIIFVIKLF